MRLPFAFIDSDLFVFPVRAGRFHSPVALFSEIYALAIGAFEKTICKTIPTGFTLRSDTFAAIDLPDPSNRGICLTAVTSTRECQAIDQIYKKESFRRRVVHIPSKERSEPSLIIEFCYGTKASARVVSAIGFLCDELQGRG